MVLDTPQNSWSVYIRWIVLLMLAFGGFMVQMVELGHIARMSSMTPYFHDGNQVNNNNNNNKDSDEDSGHEAAAAAAAVTKKVAPTTTTSTMAPTTLFREEYFSEEDGIFKGILSTKPKSFFQKFQEEIDAFDLEERCRRCGFGMTAREGLPERPNRRIYYGALINEEAWELVDILATETHGVFEGMVFVESNRTHMLYPRPIRRANKQKYIDQFKEMFGVEKLQIREFVDEVSRATDLVRENNQRAEILKGWKELGMTKDDIGYIGDMDESFTRDFLRAAQQCPDVKQFDYEVHKCDSTKSKLLGSNRVFESSPECVTKNRSWFHPDMVIGGCIEEIGDESVHPRAPRSNGFSRDHGWASEGSDVQNLPDNTSFPLYSAGDFRMQDGGFMVRMDESDGSSGHSAFHMHNFFANFNTTRHKYLTYTHPVAKAMTLPLEELAPDLRLLVRCVYNQTDGPVQKDADVSERQDFMRVMGGLDMKHPAFPIYFQDEDYRRRRHESITRLVKEDEFFRRQRLNLTAEDLEVEELVQQMREAKRFIWAKEARVQELRDKINTQKSLK